MEDIECRLYSQVYHSNVENEETNVSSQPTITSYVINKIHNNRYFSKRHISGQSVFIPLEQESTTISNKTYPSVCNSISFNPNSTAIATEENIGNQIQNNITVNQYTLPLIINPDLNEVLNPRYSAGKLFVPWSNKNKKLLDKRNRKQQRRLENRRQKNKEKRNQNPVSNSCVELNGNIQRKQANHIVFISDESDNECIIINEMSKKTLKSNKKPEVYNTQDGVRSESDDDIIYIPPPPVEVINVDVDVEEEATGNIHKVSDNTVSTISEKVLTSAELVISSNKSNNHPSDTNELSNTLECCTSNDFLDNSNIENNTSKFNFSLHGSDFNSTGDFLRPANPVDYCETESSCSTNDFNRENSSVKTVVFNEVDFPREDIFSDKNLEGFSSYITPKRDMSKTTKVPSKAPKSAISTVNKISNENETSLSSSESEYESFNILNRSNKVGDMEFNKKLPTLSPMHGEKIVSSTKKVTEKKPVKSSSNKVQTTHNTRNHSSKRKSNAVDSTESDSDIDEEQLKIKTRKLTKKKKKASNKKKNPSEELDKNISADLQNQNTEVNKDCNDGSNTDGGENISTVVCETRVKKKVKNSLEKVLDNERHLKQTDNDIYNHVKDINTEDSVQIINEDVESNTNLMNMSRKKKKKNSSNCRKSEEDSTSFSGSDRTAIEKVKKKKKKSSSENFGNSDLNQTESEIIDINSANTENQSSNNRDHSTLNDNKRSISSLEAFELQNEKINLCAKQAENKCDSDKNREDSTQNINNTKNVFAENESDEEIIIVDEVVFHESDANTEDHIVVSSDSEYDFRQLEDVGQNLELANCVANGAVNKIGTDDSENNFYAVNKNLCEDYSKFDVEQIQNTQSGKYHLK